MGGEEWIGFAYLGADGSLDGGLDFGLLARCYATEVSSIANTWWI